MTKTLEGLPVVSGETFMEFLRNYNIASENNDPKITEKIKEENPQIYRIINIGMREAPNKEARVYLEAGMQICYELLRKENEKELKISKE